MTTNWRDEAEKYITDRFELVDDEINEFGWPDKVNEYRRIMEHAATIAKAELLRGAVRGYVLKGELGEFASGERDEVGVFRERQSFTFDRPAALIFTDGE